MSVLDQTLRPGHLAGLTIQKAGEQAPHINMLIYGQYGVGKTLLAGSADEVPELRKVLVLDIEGGALTLRHTFPNVDTVRITNWDDLANIYNELRSGLQRDYNTIVVDSLTEAQSFNMDAIMMKMVAHYETEGKMRDEDIAGLQEWQKNQSQIRKFIRLYRDLPVTVIFTALVKEDRDKMSGKVRILPNLPGKLAGQVPAMFDEVLYYNIQTLDGTPVRVLQTASTEKVAAKDRSGQLDAMIPNPTMKILYDKMMKRSNNEPATA
jgi:hypothetical protein